MALLSVTPITKAGIPNFAGTLVAAEAAGDSVNSSSGIFITMANGDASAHTLTVAAPVSSTNCGGYGALPVDDIPLVVAAGGLGVVAIPSNYIDGNGNFAWTYDDVTSVTVGVTSIAP